MLQQNAFCPPKRRWINSSIFKDCCERPKTPFDRQKTPFGWRKRKNQSTSLTLHTVSFPQKRLEAEIHVPRLKSSFVQKAEILHTLGFPGIGLGLFPKILTQLLVASLYQFPKNGLLPYLYHPGKAKKFWAKPNRTEDGPQLRRHRHGAQHLRRELLGRRGPGRRPCRNVGRESEASNVGKPAKISPYI